MVCVNVKSTIWAANVGSFHVGHVIVSNGRGDGGWVTIVLDFGGLIGNVDITSDGSVHVGCLAILWNFDKWQITKRRSEELRSEFTRLMLLKWQTRVICGKDFEEAKEKIRELGQVPDRGTKRKSGVETEWDVTKRRRTAVAEFPRSWALPLVGPIIILIGRFEHPYPPLPSPDQQLTTALYPSPLKIAGVGE